jgi:hypothetical protein
MNLKAQRYDAIVSDDFFSAAGKSKSFCPEKMARSRSLARKVNKSTFD